MLRTALARSVRAASIRSVTSARTATAAVRLPQQRLSSISPLVYVASYRAMSGGSHGFLPREEVETRVLSLVKGFNKVKPEKVNATSHFINDLGLDSLDAVELVMAIEEEFDLSIADSEAEKIVSCKDAIDYVATHPNAK